MALTSCSKSPEEKLVSVLDEMTEILNDTTADNIDKQTAKLEDLKSDAKKVGEALAKLSKEDSATELNGKQFEEIGNALKKNQKAVTALIDRVGSNNAAKLSKTAAEVQAILMGMSK